MTGVQTCALPICSKAEPKKVEINVEEGKKKETDEKKKPEGVTVKVDADGLSDRIVKLPLPQGYHGNLYSDGQKVYYSRNNSTYVYDLNKQKEETVAEGARMWVEPGGKKAGFFKNKQLFVKDIPSGKIDLKDPVNFSDMKITIDYAKEWAQIFDEAWRAFRDGFYLENMHGVDWKAMKKKYGVLLPYVKNCQDLSREIGRAHV